MEDNYFDTLFQYEPPVDDNEFVDVTPLPNFTPQQATQAPMNIDTEIIDKYNNTTLVGQVNKSEVMRMVQFNKDGDKITGFDEMAMKKYFTDMNYYYQSDKITGGMTYNPYTKTWATYSAYEALLKLIQTTLESEAPAIRSLLKQKHLIDISNMVVQEVKGKQITNDLFDKGQDEIYLLGLPNAKTYDFRTNEIRESEKEDFIMTRTDIMPIPYDYKNEKNIVSEWFEWLVGDSVKTVEQYIGYAMCRTNKVAQKFMVFTDDKTDSNSKSGGNGKSTMLDVIQMLFSDSMKSTFDLAELTKNDNKFTTSGFYTKQLSVDTDSGATYLKNTNTIKKITGGDNVKAEFKGEKQFTYKSYCKLIFSTNTLPRFGDSSDGFQRRMLPIAFLRDLTSPETPDSKYSKEHFDYLKFTNDPEIMGKFMWKCIQEFRDIWFIDGVEQTQATIYEAESTKSLLAFWNNDNDQLSEFVDNELEYTGNKDDKINIEMLRKLYNEFCDELRIKEPVSARNLPKQLTKSLKHKFPNSYPDYKKIRLGGTTTYGFEGFKFKKAPKTKD